jgi:aryl-alcohol dehydrogenase-like predicted oxidoreductase
MKLGLGTVQFGIDYGISNKNGKTSLEEVRHILTLASEWGIHTIDTAALYGSSEEALGRAMPRPHPFSIVTKTPRLLENGVLTLERSFHKSLSHLNQSSVYGLLVHHAEDLFIENGDMIFRKMIELKEMGMVQKIGVSIYTAKQIDRVLNHFPIDLIQLPVNVFDQRLLESGHITKLKKTGIEIHARSAFLQGLILMDPNHLPRKLHSVRRRLEHFQKTMREMGVTPLQAALGFVLSLDEVDKVICGVNHHRQLKEMIESMNNPIPNIDFSSFAMDDEMILNPSNWGL